MGSLGIDWPRVPPKSPALLAVGTPGPVVEPGGRVAFLMGAKGPRRPLNPPPPPAPVPFPSRLRLDDMGNKRGPRSWPASARPLNPRRELSCSRPSLAAILSFWPDFQPSACRFAPGCILRWSLIGGRVSFRPPPRDCAANSLLRPRLYWLHPARDSLPGGEGGGQEGRLYCEGILPRRRTWADEHLPHLLPSWLRLHRWRRAEYPWSRPHMWWRVGRRRCGSGSSERAPYIIKVCWCPTVNKRDEGQGRISRISSS